MPKLLALISASFLCFMLAGCGGSEKNTAEQIAENKAEVAVLAEDLDALAHRITLEMGEEDLEAACARTAEMASKIDRLSDLTDELRNEESVERSLIFKLQTAESGMRAGLAPTQKVCASISSG